MPKIRIISPGESKLAKVMFMKGNIKSNGPIYDFSKLKVDYFDEFRLRESDLRLASSTLINSGSGRGGKNGHYHVDRKEIFVAIDAEFLLFLSNLGDKKEIIYFNTRPPKHEKHFRFPVLYIPEGIAHYVYNHTGQRQCLDVLSKVSEKDSEQTTYAHDAVEMSIDRVVKAFYASRR